ncbi:MAG TPA: hypothetical protein VD996_04880 [Chitinophagaceae bacterium]|nr:hypothetical protein [Chitinophagaceae bacterium]
MYPAKPGLVIGFHEKNHIQLCIRNPNCIKGYFLPRTAHKSWTIP